MPFDPTVAWPTGSMGILVEAAYHVDPIIAARRWEEWKESTPDLDTIDWQTARVLAQSATSLSSRGIESTNVATLKGVRQFDWALGENHLHDVRPFLNALAQAGIPVMVIKGAALLLSALNVGTTRLMADIDMLIEPAHIDNVLDVAASVGWGIKRPLSREHFREILLSSKHSFSLTNGEKSEVDLHTFALLLNRCPDHDLMLWARGTKARFGDVDVLVPSVTDMLVVTIGRGLLYNPRPLAVWVGDSISLIESGAVDWDIFLEEIERRDLATFAYAGIEYISQVLGRPVPAYVRTKLASWLCEPFISEFLGYIKYWEATSRTIRASWGAAASIRAEKWQSRRNSYQSIFPVAATAVAIKTGWQIAARLDDTRFTVGIPEEIHQVSAQCFLEIKLVGDEVRCSHRLGVALTCFDHSICEVGNLELPIEYPVDANLQQEKFIQFPVNTAIIAAYSLRKFRLELLESGTLDASAIRLDAVEYRWQT